MLAVFDLSPRVIRVATRLEFPEEAAARLEEYRAYRAMQPPIPDDEAEAEFESGYEASRLYMQSEARRKWLEGVL
jgi:hypothetical protein